MSHPGLIVTTVAREDRAHNHQGGRMIDEATSHGETTVAGKNAALLLNMVEVRRLAITGRSAYLCRGLLQAAIAGMR